MAINRNDIMLVAGAAGGVLLCFVSYCTIPNIVYSIRMFVIDQQTKKDSSIVFDTVEKMCGEDGAVTVFPNQVTPNQIDRSKHMNNANYLYELNFSRRHFCNSLGLWSILRKLNANMVVQCQTIRYRKELRVWQSYSIRTRILEIDEEEGCFYLESRFLTEDNFVAAIHHVKYKIVAPKCENGSRRKISPVDVLIDAGVLQLPSRSESREIVKVNPNGFIAMWEKGNKFSSKELFSR